MSFTRSRNPISHTWTGKNQVITISNSRPVTFSGFKKGECQEVQMYGDSIDELDLPGCRFPSHDPDSIDIQQQIPHLEAYVIDNKLLLNEKEPIFLKKGPNDYIIQPKAMLNRGSMCITELYGQKAKIQIINEILNNKIKQLHLKEKKDVRK